VSDVGLAVSGESSPRQIIWQSRLGYCGAALTVAALNHILAITSLTFCVVLRRLVSFGVALSRGD
jgi:hypothetical protein